MGSYSFTKPFIPQKCYHLLILYKKPLRAYIPIQNIYYTHNKHWHPSYSEIKTACVEVCQQLLYGFMVSFCTDNNNIKFGSITFHVNRDNAVKIVGMSACLFGLVKGDRIWAKVRQD